MKLYTDKIKAIRKKKKKKVSQLAADLNVSVNTFYRWERNESNPSCNDVRVLAHLLDTDPSVISDLKPFKKYENIYNEKELIDLLNIDNLSIEARSTVLRVDKILNHLKIENKSLLYQNARYRKVMEHKLIPEYTKGKDLKYSYFNYKFKILFGKDKKIIGENNISIFPAREAELLTKLERSILQTGVPIENYKITLNGNEYLFFGFLVKDDNIDSSIIVVNLVDIDYYTQKAEIFREIYHSLENLGIAVWIKKTKPYPHYEYFSNNIEKIFEHPYPTIINNPNLWREIVHPDDLGRIIPVEPLIKGERKKTYKYRIYTKEKRIKWISEHLSYDNKTDTFIGFISDITDEMKSDQA